jgi:HSP20 family protein
MRTGGLSVIEVQEEMTMTVLTRWSPVRDLAALEVDRLNRMFQTVWGGEAVNGPWAPAVDIYTNANQDVVIKAEVPDIKREDLKVTFENTVLTIEGERKFDATVAHDQYDRIERQYGSFRRSFTLPASVDSAHAQASYQDGVLTITLPKREESKPRQIQVNG